MHRDVTCLVLSSLQTHIVAELEHAAERIMQHSHAFFAQGKIEDHHAGLFLAGICTGM
jgi:hypothetical protein